MISIQARKLSKITANHLSKFQFDVTLNHVISPLFCYDNGNSSSTNSWLFSRTATTSHGDMGGLTGSSKDAIAFSIKEWFKSRNDALLADIFKILRAVPNGGGDYDDMSSRRLVDLALSNLGLKLNEAFVLDVLSYGKYRDVLSCLKFFDWAGRQPGFQHTRATFHAILKILSRARLMSVIIDFLDSYSRQYGAYRLRFQSTLVMGYAVAGKPEFALQLFGRMRFHGLDLDTFGYHVLLNALVENDRFDAVKVISKQIQIRGFENHITSTIMMKSFCKQKLFDEAEAYLHEVVIEGRDFNGYVLGVLVDALCRCDEFARAEKLIEEFQQLGVIPMLQTYDTWVRHLVNSGRLDAALEFLKEQKSLDGYVPSMFRYNMLICRLLLENRLHEAYELLIEMKESGISPDEFTMNAALCFFCKAGMLSVALDLYNSRSEFGLSPNSMVYNYLINTLCGDGSIDQAYCVLQDSVDQGYFPGKKAFSILAEALCREGKLDKVKDLLLFAFDRKVMPSSSTYDKFISSLCKASRVEDGYLIYGEVNKLNEATSSSTYFHLINGFSKSNRGDIAAKLIIEMQEKGHRPNDMLFGIVIRCLCKMANPRQHFFKFLEIQLSRDGPRPDTFNIFIDGAGQAKKPELAREIYEMMLRSGSEPTLSTDILMLRCYLLSERISDAMNFFNSLRNRKNFGRRLWSIMVTGLCKVNRLDIALEFFKEMKKSGVSPTIECYELLIKLLCSNERYNMAITLVKEFEKSGRILTPFIGNTLLLHSCEELYNTWIHQSEDESDEPGNQMLGPLIGVFCNRVRLSEHIDNVEEEIGKCYPVDVFTCNMLLRRLSLVNINYARELFHRMCRKGHEPNRWTYDILVHGFLKHGRKREASRWFEEMLRKGFHPSRSTTMLI